MCGWRAGMISLCCLSLCALPYLVFRGSIPRIRSRRSAQREAEEAIDSSKISLLQRQGLCDLPYKSLLLLDIHIVSRGASLVWNQNQDINMSSTLFEMALLHAISDFNDERDRTLHKDGAQNQSEILELTPKHFKTLVNLVKAIPIKNVEKLNRSMVTHNTEKNREQVKEDHNNLKIFSNINSILQKLHLNGNIIKIVNGKSLLQRLRQQVTTKASPVKENETTSKDVALVEALDIGNTSQANNVSDIEQVVIKSVPEGIPYEGERGLDYLAAQMAEEINRFLQNDLLANKTAGMLASDSLHGYEQHLSELLGKLNKMVATAPEEVTADKKKDLLISERTLLKILDLSSSVLKDLNGQLSGNSPHKVGNSGSDKYSSEEEELATKESEWEELDQINHFIQMFYQLEENLSNLKIFLEDYKEGEKHDMVKRLLDQSLSVVSQLEQIPWLKGRNSFIDFELEALRDFAGVLSNVELIPHETTVGST